MKLAIIGSRTLQVEIEKYLPSGITEIVSGGAKGVDQQARVYAQIHQIKMTEFLPQYDKYRRNAPLVRNRQIVEYADCLLIFWDGKSKGTKYTIDYAKKQNKPMQLILI